MPGLSTEVAVHKLGVQHDGIPVKQAPRACSKRSSNKSFSKLRNWPKRGSFERNNIPLGWPTSCQFERKMVRFRFVSTTGI
ncbi:hypothetical protein MA16_Dca023757 [Dendrobium catenatum]|uniref:Uncharacterized protein n=1 Tax=Dendrobium catenatum TaxID=906689 RepID=A0A2I0XGM4_9ASPA|nr:hypothetical protein MA16_Dca023757 [Dendrobium catenatum]